MQNNNWLQQNSSNLPGWFIHLLPFISAVLGGGILWLTWVLYQDSIVTPGFPWFRWIPAVFMVIASLMSFAASVLFAMRRPTAWDALWTAICIIPIVLFLRLIVAVVTITGLAVRWVGENPDRLLDGSFLENLLNPVQIVIIILVLLALIAHLSKASTSKNSSTRDADER